MYLNHCDLEVDYSSYNHYCCMRISSRMALATAEAYEYHACLSSHTQDPRLER